MNQQSVIKNQQWHYSVLTDSPLFSSAALSVCQGSVAHLTRTGYFFTPAKTASLPSDSACWGVNAGSVVMWWKPSKSLLISSRLFPLAICVIIDADAVQMAQPLPVKAM